jgi:hypothetical protein
MSAASTPVPRTKSPTETRSSTTRHTFFWPIFIYLLGAGSLALYQVLAMEDQYETLTQSVDKMDSQVKRGLYEKSKFFRIAGDVLRLAPRDSNAEQIATHYKLRLLQEKQPELMNANAPSDMAQLNIAPQTAADTNAAPLNVSPVTNAAPPTVPSPATK